MKYVFTAFLTCMVAYCVSGQGLKTLVSALEKAETDSLKIAAYQRIVDHYRYSNADSARYYAKKGYTHSRQKDYRFGEAVMINCLAQVNEQHGFLEAAKENYENARGIFTVLGYKKGIAATTNGLGVVAGRTGQYDEATSFFLQALNLYDEIHDSNGLVQTNIKLGVVNVLLGNLDEGLAYYLKAEALNTSLPSSNASLTLFNNIGVIYGKRDDIPTALKYFRKGLKQSDPETSTGIHITLLGSLGLAHEKSGNRDSALYFQEQALHKAMENSLPEEEARALVNLASLYSKTEPVKSLDLLEKALVITERIQQLNLMTDVYESMISLYKEGDNFEQALLLSEKRQLLKDSLFSIQKSKEIANLHANHELARQENEIRNLALRNEKSIFQRNIMLAVALIAVAMIGIVWFYNTKISNLNTQLIKKQTELKNSNTVKDKLFSILGHDLRAPLSRVIGLLSVLGSENKSDDESMIIEKLTQQSVNTLETLDNLLMWGQSQLKGIRLKQENITVKEQISKSIFLTSDYAAQKNVRLVDNTPADLLIYADPSHFDFIVRNLLSNAIKFSHSGGAVVVNAFTSDNQQVVFSIKDSGIGIPANQQYQIFTAGHESLSGTWNEKGTGIGLMLCREYIAENGGKLWVESEEGKGTTFYFCFLINKPSDASRKVFTEFV